MSSSPEKETLRAELMRLERDPNYKMFRGAIEKLQILTNAQLGDQTVPPDLIHRVLGQIKSMQEDIQKGANPREAYERAVESSQESSPKVFGTTPSGGDAVVAQRDAYKTEGDLMRANRDAIKTDTLFSFNFNTFFTETYGELKRSSDQIIVQVVLLVMTAEEARELNSERIFQNFNNPVYRSQFQSLCKKLSESQLDDALQRYGPNPENWRPFRGDDTYMTIGEAIKIALGDVKGFTKPLVPDFRDIRLLAPEVGEKKARAALRLLRDEGCMVVMDSISMHHPVIQRAYRRSLIDVYSTIPVVRVTPIPGGDIWDQDMLNFGDKFPDTEVYKRLNWDSDDSCREANKEPSLRRWIVGNAPLVLRRRGYYKQDQADAQSAYKDNNGVA